MIILTTDGIRTFNYPNVSSTVEYGGQVFCLAEVPDNFSVNDKIMKACDIGFWWAVAGGTFIDTELWDYEQKFKGGLVEGIEFIYSLSKENNIAMTINVLAQNAGVPPFELWEKQKTSHPYVKP